MLFRPKRIVHATTEQEIDAALATADQVIVEGDDQLLSYAVGKASADPENKITVETGEVTTTITPEPPLLTPPSPPPLRQAHPLRNTAIFLSLSLVAVAIVATYYLMTADPFTYNLQPTPLSPDHPQPTPLPPASAEMPGTPGTPVTRSTPPPDYTLTLVQTLVWPVVTMVSIIALFLIAWKAIVGGRNVEITWKVTEKVQGKVVISKQRAASKQRRAVA